MWKKKHFYLHFIIYWKTHKKQSGEREYKVMLVQMLAFLSKDIQLMCQLKLECSLTYGMTYKWASTLVYQ